MIHYNNKSCYNINIYILYNILKIEKKYELCIFFLFNVVAKLKKLCESIEFFNEEFFSLVIINE